MILWLEKEQYKVLFWVIFSLRQKSDLTCIAVADYLELCQLY